MEAHPGLAAEGNEAFIVPPFFKCLEGFVTLTAALAKRSRTGLYEAAISRHPAIA